MTDKDRFLEAAFRVLDQPPAAARRSVEGIMARVSQSSAHTDAAREAVRPSGRRAFALAMAAVILLAGIWVWSSLDSKPPSPTPSTTVRSEGSVRSEGAAPAVAPPPALGPAAPAEGSDPVAEALVEVQRLMDDGRLDEALAKLEELRERYHRDNRVRAMSVELSQRRTEAFQKQLDERLAAPTDEPEPNELRAQELPAMDIFENVVPPDLHAPDITHLRDASGGGPERDQRAMGAFVATKSGVVDACVMEHGGDAQGSILIAFTVETTGRVVGQAVEAVQGDARLHDVAACISSAAARWRFPLPSVRRVYKKRWRFGVASEPARSTPQTPLPSRAGSILD